MTRRREWLRRNAAALATVAVLLPATAFVLLGLPAIEVADSVENPRLVSAGETVNDQGYDYTLTGSTETVGRGVEANRIPLGASLVVARFSVEPDGTEPAELCDVVLTDRSDPSTSERTWRPQISPGTYGYVADLGTRNFCNPARDEPQTLELVFLTPAGTYSTATVDFSIRGESSTLLRFALR